MFIRIYPKRVKKQATEWKKVFAACITCVRFLEKSYKLLRKIRTVYKKNGEDTGKEGGCYSIGFWTVRNIQLFNLGISFTSNHFIIFIKLDVYVLYIFKCVLYN